jgi:hypothetical protein
MLCAFQMSNYQIQLKFLSQYKLTSDVKPQSYERTPEGQEKKENV